MKDQQTVDFLKIAAHGRVSSLASARDRCCSVRRIAQGISGDLPLVRARAPALMGATLRKERVVEDRNRITAGGVTAGLDSRSPSQRSSLMRKRQNESSSCSNTTPNHHTMPAHRNMREVPVRKHLEAPRPAHRGSRGCCQGSRCEDESVSASLSGCVTMNDASCVAAHARPRHQSRKRGALFQRLRKATLRNSATEQVLSINNHSIRKEYTHDETGSHRSTW